MRKLLAALATTTLFATVPAHAQTWMAYTNGPSDTMTTTKGLKTILDRITAETNGEVKFRLRLGGSLPIQSSNITQAVGSGSIQFAEDGFFQGNVKVSNILRLPMLLHTPQDYDLAAKTLEPYIEKEFAQQGVVVLGRYIYPHQTAYSAKPLAQLADFNQQKIRVTSAEQSEIISRFGGIPVSMGTPEVASALQSGALDGALTANSGGGRLWRESFRFNYRFPVNYFDGLYIVNKTRFDKLKPETQQKIRAIVAEVAPQTTRNMLAEEEALGKTFADAGMKITAAQQADIDKATEMIRPYWDQWAKQQGPEVVEALGKVRAALKR
jgi:TRAP-type C4-dicarboxylate transport system substrate-binding protein